MELPEIVPQLMPNGLTFCIGIDDQSQEPLLVQLQDCLPLFLCTPPGKLTRQILTSMLVQLYARNDAEHLQVAFFDGDAPIAEPFRDLPQTRKNVYALLADLQQQVWQPGQAAHPPLTLIVVDQFASSSPANAALRNALRFGRKRGVLPVIAASSLPAEYGAFMRGQITARTADSLTFAALGGEPRHARPFPPLLPEQIAQLLQPS